jgi:hypothetical protein
MGPEHASRLVPSSPTAATPAPSATPAPAHSATPTPAPPPDPENRSLPPLSSPDLDERARHLFDAVVSGRPELALDFFFPREPFIPLKDVADAGRYHDELVATYRRDVMALHGARRSWEGAVFETFELGTKPVWIRPGREWNKIGYFRTLDARLTYKVAGKRRVLAVRTIISWQGRWYVTHLRPLNPKH